LVGPLLVWFRTLWNNVATRWYVTPIIQQQTGINHRLRAEIAALREELRGEQEIRHVLDKEIVTTRRDQATALYSLQAEVARLRARLEEAEQQISKVASG
jgi:predicted  nucleic acid-binding Zn-ribbon protein